MKLKSSLSLIGLLGQKTLAGKQQYNWQKHGTCGVPSTQSKDQLFNGMAGRSIGANSDNAQDEAYKQQLADAMMEVINDNHNSAGDMNAALQGVYKNFNREMARDEVEAQLEAASNVNTDYIQSLSGGQAGFRSRTRRDTDSDDNDNGNYTIDARIVGGDEAVQNSWPWQVFVKFGFDCGGALIDDYWVITAAHCISQSANALRSAYVRVGAHVHTSNNPADPLLGRRIAIEQVVVHPQYNAQNFKYDLALLKLKKAAIPRNNDGPDLSKVAPICLSNDKTCFDKRTPCVVTGWGVNDAETWERHDTLQEVAVRLMSTDECTTHSTYKAYFHPESMLCAGWADGGKDACAGDSGGPLVCRVPEERTVNGKKETFYGNQWVLYGLVSWGLGCAKVGQPGVYTNVPILSDWVSETIQANDENLPDWQPDDAFDYGGKCKSWDQTLEDQWRLDISEAFVGQKPSLSESQEAVIVEENEQANTMCDIKAPVLAFNGLESMQDPENPGHVYLPLTPEEHDVLISPVPNKVFWWSKWTKLDQIYPKNQDCSFVFTNTNDEMRIKVTIVRSKIDCAGLTAPKQIRTNPNYDTGDNLMLESDTVNSKYSSHTVGCPSTANVKKTTITMYGAGWVKLKLKTDDFRTQDSFGNDASKQRFEGSFVAKVSVVPKYSDCSPGYSNKEFLNAGEKIYIKSPGYPRFYSGDSQCRMHIHVAPGSGLKIVYKILKMELKTRQNTCSADRNDAILWLQNQIGCKNSDIFDGPGQFKQDQLVGQNCGRSKKQKTYNELNQMTSGCFIFAANGARLNEDARVRTGRFLIEIKTVREDYVVGASKNKKRKKRALGEIPTGPLGQL